MSGGAQVAGIVISAIDYNSLVSMCCIDVLVTTIVYAWNFSSTPLAVHEVDCFPDTAEPCVITDSEGTSQRVSGLDRIGAWLAKLRKVQSLIFAERSTWLFY